MKPVHTSGLCRNCSSVELIGHVLLADDFFELTGYSSARLLGSTMKPESAARWLMKTLEELIRELPPQLQNEVRKYAQYLVDTKVKPQRKYLRMDWVGGS